jgi:outer membrane biosynthesis protein TonB
MEKGDIINAAKELNNSGLASIKVKVVAINDADLTSMFMRACESVKTEDEDKLPKVVSETYNLLADALAAEDNSDTPEEKTKTSKKKPEKKVEKKPEKKVEKKPEKKPEKKVEKKPEKKVGETKERQLDLTKDTLVAFLKKTIDKKYDGKNTKLEDLFADKTLVERYKGRKSYIRYDFARLIDRNLL